MLSPTPNIPQPAVKANKAQENVLQSDISYPCGCVIRIVKMSSGASAPGTCPACPPPIRKESSTQTDSNDEPKTTSVPPTDTVAAHRQEGSPTSRHSKRSRRGGHRTSSHITRGGSSADTSAAGPGLDLAAELGRAESKDVLEGKTEPSGQIDPSAQVVDSAEVQALRSEVKALKDANKALSLYASKIRNRIADYETSKKGRHKDVPAAEKPQPESEPRPKSSFFPSMSVQEDQPPKPLENTPPAMNRATSESIFSGASSSAMAATSSAPLPSPSPATNPSTPNVSTESAADKRTRRTLSMDWKGITGLFGGGSSASPAEVKTDKLRPLTLRAGTSINGQGTTSVPSSTSFARKVGTIEGENDRRERERMLATMKLMGIENPSVASPSPPLAKPTSSVSPFPTPPDALKPRPSSRVPFFTRLRSSEAIPQVPAAPLTAEALERAEAESSIAALDAKEKALTAEYAKGKSASTSTELNGGRLSDGYRKKNSQKSASGGGRGRVSIDVGDDGRNHSRAEVSTRRSLPPQDEERQVPMNPEATLVENDNTMSRSGDNG